MKPEEIYERLKECYKDIIDLSAWNCVFLTISEDGVQIHSREMNAKLNFEPLEDDLTQHAEGIPYAPEHYNYDDG